MSVRRAVLKRFCRLNGDGFTTLTSSRCYSSIKPQSEPFFEDLPTAAGGSHVSGDVQLTTLNNGVRVVSKMIPGAWCNVTALVNIGARHETADNLGASYFFERLAFKSTSNSSHEDVIKRIEKLGGDIMTFSNREAIMMSANLLHRHVESGLQLMGEALISPGFNDAEIEHQKQLVVFEEESALQQPPNVALDMTHKAAYQHQSMGHEMRPPLEVAENIKPAIVQKFYDCNFHSDRIVISGVGIDHDALVQYAEEAFGPGVLPSSQTHPLPEAPRVRSLNAEASQAQQFIGGSNIIQATEPLLHPALQIPLSHCALAFEVDYYRYLVWLSCRHRRHHGASYVVSFLLLSSSLCLVVGRPSPLEDLAKECTLGRIPKSSIVISGLKALKQQRKLTPTVACLSYNLRLKLAKCDFPHVAQNLNATKEANAMAVMIRLLYEASQGITHAELTRARNQLKALMLTNLESRAIAAEDLARQIQMSGKHFDSDELAVLLDSVTVTEVQDAARKLLRSPIAVAALSSDTSKIPSHSMLQQYLDNNLE